METQCHNVAEALLGYVAFAKTKKVALEPEKHLDLKSILLFELFYLVFES